MNPLVASAIAIFALYVVCVAVYFLITGNERIRTRVRLQTNKVRNLMQDDEDECPDWADPVKWRESLK